MSLASGDTSKRCESYYCGQYQISYTYWAEAGKPATAAGVREHEKCARDRNCSEQAVRAYFKRYKRDCNNDGVIDCLDMAALHKGGPMSCASNWFYTSKFWLAFNKTTCAQQPDKLESNASGTDETTSNEKQSMRPTRNQTLTTECLECICDAISGCSTGVNNCGSSSVCGPLALSQNYWKEGRRPGASWTACTRTKECSIVTVKNYMEKHKRDCNGDGFVTCEDYAAIHRRGPRACSHSDLLKDHYWNKFLSCRANQKPSKDVNMVKVSDDSNEYIKLSPGTGDNMINLVNRVDPQQVPAVPSSVPTTNTAISYETTSLAPSSTLQSPQSNSSIQPSSAHRQESNTDHTHHKTNNHAHRPQMAVDYETKASGAREEPVEPQTSQKQDFKPSQEPTTVSKPAKLPVPEYISGSPLLIVPHKQIEVPIATVSRQGANHQQPSIGISSASATSSTQAPIVTSEATFIEHTVTRQNVREHINKGVLPIINKERGDELSESQTDTSRFASLRPSNLNQATGNTGSGSNLANGNVDDIDYPLPDIPFMPANVGDSAPSKAYNSNQQNNNNNNFDSVVTGIVTNTDFGKTYQPMPKLSAEKQPVVSNSAPSIVTDEERQLDALASQTVPSILNDNHVTRHQTSIAAQAQEAQRAPVKHHGPTVPLAAAPSPVSATATATAAAAAPNLNQYQRIVNVPARSSASAHKDLGQTTTSKKATTSNILGSGNVMSHSQSVSLPPIDKTRLSHSSHDNQAQIDALNDRIQMINETQFVPLNFELPLNMSTTLDRGSNESMRIPSECLNCICEASSNCDTTVQCISKQRDKNRCGLYMISWNQFQESDIAITTSLIQLPPGVNEDTPDEKFYQQCSTDKHCAEKLIHLYMEKHQKDCNADGKIDCYDMAAIHRVGPEQCNSGKFLASQYWKDFNVCYTTDRLMTTTEQPVAAVAQLMAA